MPASGLAGPQPNSLAEFALGSNGYGGDLQLTSSGDLLKIIDTPAYPSATVQRVSRIIMTCPRIMNAAGQPICKADDIFNPSFGSGATVLVGEPLTAQLVSGLQSRIAAALAQDSAIANSPPPTVQVFTDGQNDGLLFVTVTFTTVTGQIVTLPNLPLQPVSS